MDPVFKFPASPGTPLFPVSPERVNRQHLPQSPSLPSTLADSYLGGHTRSPSDVQGKVAQFNNLSREAAQRRRDSEAALKRAVLGREEAESETRRLKEEHRGLRNEIEEGRGRERRVGERLEALMVSFAAQFVPVSPHLDFRRSCSGRKRPTRIPKPSTRRKSAEQGKRRSNHPVRWSSYKRSSRQQGTGLL